MLLKRMVGSQVAEDDCASSVVGEDAFGSTGYVWVGAAGDPAFLHRNKAQDAASRILPGSLCWKRDFVK